MKIRMTDDFIIYVEAAGEDRYEKGIVYDVSEAKARILVDARVAVVC
jgi:hypothetical protein